MKDPLGDRMKGLYEDRAKTRLVRRMPVIIRIDGKGFSRFCKRFPKPFANKLHQIFNATVIYLCKEISGVVCAEHHSDEISLLLVDYQSLQTEAYFDYEVQKICSVVAGLTTAKFCMLCHGYGYIKDGDEWPSFDARCFNIPKEEVENYFWWRMKDAVRNSIGMLAQSKFSHQELHGKNINDMQEMLFQTHSINWSELPAEQKNGWLFVKRYTPFEIPHGPKKGEQSTHSEWTPIPSPATRTELTHFMIDNQIPI